MATVRRFQVMAGAVVDANEQGAGSRAGPRRGDLLLDRSMFQIRLANTPKDRRRSWALAERMYSARGYRNVHEAAFPASRGGITLQACNGANVFGTIDICFDSEAGLPADSVYHAEIDRYRAKGAEVAQVSRLAIDPELGSKMLLGALFHVAYILLRPLGKASDVFIEVHPRHEAFYRRMLLFRRVGDRKLCLRVDAPAVLMRAELSHVGQQIAALGGALRGSRTLYPYFCSKEQEVAIIHRVLSLSRWRPEAH